MAPAADAVLIAGPTGSGKSRFALDLAESVGGIIVNADAMQVYRELRILTARPSLEDEARAPHRLYGFRPAAEPYSVGLWLADVARELDAAAAQRRPVFIVGGTGLYFTALTEGLADIPPIPETVRAKWRDAAAIQPADQLHRILSERDPATAARVHPADPQRIVRALEVLEGTGRPLSDWQAQAAPPLLKPGAALKLVLLPDRAELYRRVEARFDAMLEAGALDEARRMAALELPPALPAMRAVGLPPLLAHLRGELPLGEAAAQARMDTRRYVKRQLTWISRRMIAWKLVLTQETERTKTEYRDFIQRRLTPLR
jgi:tRNA dimethylallyltransferase